MSQRIISAQAPSNIALIKYMGKKDSCENIPENPSISMTLNSLCTLAEITQSSGKGPTSWVPELPRAQPRNSAGHGFVIPKLKESGMNRIVRHVERVKNSVEEVFPKFGLEYRRSKPSEQQWVLRTANTFPEASGIASSASSFAATTLAVAAACAANPDAFHQAWKNEPVLRRALARIARKGSGSSCRSFEGPWVLWDNEDAMIMNAGPMPRMSHFVILFRTTPKKVSSSEAHSLIRTSPLWEARVERVESRTRMMMAAFGTVDIRLLARIAWAEAWEMHSLFHTCADPFTYWEPGTVEGLQWFASLIDEPNPPIVTLDAGPNIHVIVEKARRDLWRERLKNRFGDLVILEDEQGEGAIINEVVSV